MMKRAGLAITSIVLGSLGMIFTAIPGGITRAAQAQAAAPSRGPVQRIVSGKVEDKSGAIIAGAVVYLKDGRTASVKSAIVDDKGAYRFVQLSQNTDYEIWARLGDKKGASKSISSFDTKNELTINLKID